jgi:hypothetical protein
LVKVKKLFDFTRSENDIYFETEGVVFLQSQLVTFHFQRCSEEGLLPMFFFAISASRYLLKITLKLHQNVNIFLLQKKKLMSFILNLQIQTGQEKAAEPGFTFAWHDETLRLWAAVFLCTCSIVQRMGVVPRSKSVCVPIIALVKNQDPSSLAPSCLNPPSHNVDLSWSLAWSILF